MGETYYKVWLHVEKINEDEGTCEDLGEPISIDYNFSKLDNAQDAVNFLTDVWDKIPSHIFKGAK